MSGVPMPYFDHLFDQLETSKGTPLGAAFRRDVHWGYYEHPERADDSLDGYVAAAQHLTSHVCTVAGVVDGMAVLDVGCGFGGALVHVDEHWSGCRLVGVNIDLRQLRRAQSLRVTDRSTDLTLVAADACALPLGSQTYDLVLALECIFHFSSRKRFFREAARVLRPGGALVLTDFIQGPGSTPLNTILTTTEMMEVKSFYGINQMMTTSDAYRRLGARVGLEGTVDEDLTRPTFPTYRAIQRLYEEDGLTSGAGATRSLEVLTSSGWLQYRLLRFEKGAPGGRSPLQHSSTR